MKIGTKQNYWLIEGNEFDISRGAKNTVTLEVTDGEKMKFDPERAALIIVDMQNFFCSSLLDRGNDGRKLAPAIIDAIASSRELGMKVAWVNWGNRADLANLPPSLQYAFKGKEEEPGIGGILPKNLGQSLIKDSWSADIIDELSDSCDSSDWRIDKYRLSGFPGTELDQILRLNGITTLFFAGVNTDQCVITTMQDAAFLGYDTILLQDCTATTSPDYVLEGTLYNIRSIGGFISKSTNLKELEMKFKEAII